MDEAEEVAGSLKPPRCPRCGAEIDHLRFFGYELVRADAIFFHNKIEYIRWFSIGDFADDVEYRCPKCDALLFRSEDEALKFFRGEL